MEKGRGSETSPEYAAAPESVSKARRFVSSALDGSGANVDDATLLASELCTNAVVHGHSVFSVTVDLFEGRVRVGVIDRSAEEPRRRRYSSTSGTGRGIAMVADLASAWGVEHVEGGKCVWFELPIDEPGSTAAAVAAAVEAAVAGDVDLDALVAELGGGWDEPPGTPDGPRARQRLDPVS